MGNEQKITQDKNLTGCQNLKNIFSEREKIYQRNGIHLHERNKLGKGKNSTGKKLCSTSTQGNDKKIRSRPT